MKSIHTKYVSKIVITLVIIVSFWIGGCDTSEQSVPTPTATEQATIIMESLISKDAATLENMLSSGIRSRPETKEQIEEFLNYIDGNIIDYSEPTGGINSKKVRDGKVVFQQIYGDVLEVKTDTGKKYRVQYCAIQKDTYQKDKEGVYCISVFDTELYNSENNYPESGISTIGDVYYSENNY